jgi:hypothetical protein
MACEKTYRWRQGNNVVRDAVGLVFFVNDIPTIRALGGYIGYRPSSETWLDSRASQTYSTCNQEPENPPSPPPAI